MHLLVVEDDQALADSLIRGLTLKGFAVDHVVEAAKARTRILLYAKEYSVIILDLGLSGEISGKDILRHVRDEGVSTPILILTGNGETLSKVDLLNCGADDYVVKPFSFDELLARINSLMRRPKTTPQLKLQAGTLSMDTATHKVSAGKKELPLTLKEYSLLEYFLRRPGEVITREELSSQMWDFNSLSWSNVLDVHMKNLRKKLEPHDTGIALETVRGVGYRLCV